MSWRCLRFRVTFTPAGPARAAARQHREECPACAAWAALLEGAATPREPLPDDLRGRLRAIPRGLRERRDAPEPLPEPLRRRLQAIARQTPAQPPLWIVQARYAAAASLLLVTLAGAAFGNPLDHGRRWTRQMGARVSGAVGEPLDRLEQAQDQVRNRGRERLAAVREELVAPWSEAVAEGVARAAAALAAAPRRAGALLDRIPGPFDLPSPDRGDHPETRPDGAAEPARETSSGETHEP